MEENLIRLIAIILDCLNWCSERYFHVTDVFPNLAQADVIAEFLTNVINQAINIISPLLIAKAMFEKSITIKCILVYWHN